MRAKEPGGAYPGVSLLTLLEIYAGGPCRKFKVKLNKRCKQFDGINTYLHCIEDKRLQVRLNQKMEISRQMTFLVPWGSSTSRGRFAAKQAVARVNIRHRV